MMPNNAPAPAPAPPVTPALLSAERLSVIKIEVCTYATILFQGGHPATSMKLMDVGADLLGHADALAAQVALLKEELAEQEKQKFTLIRELEASEKYRRLLTKTILHGTTAQPDSAP